LSGPLADFSPPADLEELRHKNLRIKDDPKHRSSISKVEIDKLYADTCTRRLYITQECLRIASTTPTSRLQAITAFYQRWLIDTSDPRLLQFWSSLDSAHETLRNSSNERGSRSTYYAMVGQGKALRFGMARVLAMRLEYHPDIVAALENLKSEMAAMALKEAAATEDDELAQLKFGRMMAHVTKKGEQFMAQKREEHEQQRRAKLKAVEEAEVAKKAKKLRQ
jgi:hypothetical protein